MPRGVCTMVVVLAATSLTACRDSGLPHRNTPVEEAASKEWRYPLYESAGTAQSGSLGLYTIGERRYLPSAALERIPTIAVRPIGIANGQQIVALAWDDEPFDRLYLAASDGRFHPLLRVP